MPVRREVCRYGGVPFAQEVRGHPDTDAEEAVVTYPLLSVMQPVGPPPAPEVPEGIGRDLDAFLGELREAGAWVFAGGQDGPSPPPCCVPPAARS